MSKQNYPRKNTNQEKEVIMNWYIVKLVFNIDIDNGKNNSQFDEQWRTILSATEEEAIILANELGSQQEESFENEQKQDVKWKFIGISDLHKLQNMDHGKEIYSSTHEATQSIEYIRMVKNRSKLILDRCAVLV